MGHVRFTRDYDKAQWHVHHSIEDAEKLVEEVAPGPFQSVRLHPSLLIRNRNRILDEGCPKYKFFEHRMLNWGDIGAHPAHDLKSSKGIRGTIIEHLLVLTTAS